MSYHYSAARIAEIVNAPKCVRDAQELKIASTAPNGAKFDADLDLLDGPYTDLRFLGRAARIDAPPTYDASLLLDQQRIRGIGFAAVPRNNFRAKLRIPAGWHQNICNPNVATNDPNWNRHESLPNFCPTDFKDFVQKAADLWKVDLGWEKGLF